LPLMTRMFLQGHYLHPKTDTIKKRREAACLTPPRAPTAATNQPRLRARPLQIPQMYDQLKPDYQRPAKRQYCEAHRRAHSIAGGHLENGVDCAAQITCSISKRES
jgi:hypothetical protein